VSPQKDWVFRERSACCGQRAQVVSDLVLRRAAGGGRRPHRLRPSAAWATRRCGDYLRTAHEAGFVSVEILKESSYGTSVAADSPLARDVARDTGLPLPRIAELLGGVTSLTLRLRP
jgi:hypothetical protein